MPALLELQRRMAALLCAQDPSALEALPALEAPQWTAQAALRLGIYRNTRSSTLINALRLSFPAVQRLVGAGFFDAAARQFIGAHPPIGAYLNDYGADFAGFLGGYAPAAGLRYLRDVAQLEWAVNGALHAEDAAGLDLARLAAVGEAAWPFVRFVAHPGLGLLRLQYPADLIWRAVLAQDDAALARIDPTPEERHLLIERDGAGVQVRRLCGAVWRFTAQLCAAVPLHAALGERPDPQLQAALAGHLSAGRFIDFQLDDRHRAREARLAHSPGEQHS